MHIDAHAATVQAWHIAATGSPWLEGEISSAMASNPFIGPAANGHVVAHRMAGPVLLGVPFYQVFNASPDPTDFGFVAGGIGAATFAALSALFVFLALRQHSGRIVAAGASLAFALATPTWTISADQLWTHTVTQFGIAGALWSCARSRFWWAGTFLAIALFGRPHIAVIAAIIGLGVGWSQRKVKPIVAIGIPAGAGLLLLSLWNRWMFGAWSIGGAYQGRAAAAVEGFQGSAEWDGKFAQFVNYAGFLVAPDRGFLVWTPAVVVVVPALFRSWSALPAWSRWAAIGGLVYTFLQLRLNYFPGGETFWGYRHGLELLTCLTPVLAFSVKKAGRFVLALLGPLLALQFGAMTLGAVSWGYFVPIEDVWRDNSLLVMWRANPVSVSFWLSLCLVAGLVGSRKLIPTTTSRAAERATYP